MNFNVYNLLQESTGSVKQIQVKEAFSDTNACENGTIEGQVRLIRTDKGIWTSASLRTVIIENCSRCLDQCHLTIELEIEEQFLQETVLTNTSTSAEEMYDQDINIIAQDNILDLDDTIRQYVEINTPMSPVCTDNCLGLCFLCGGNLNITRCICEGLNIDPRWRKLQDFAQLKDD